LAAVGEAKGHTRLAAAEQSDYQVEACTGVRLKN
jgi:hypothetical protein